MAWSNLSARERLSVEKAHSLSLSVRVEDRLHRDIIQPTDTCWLTVRPVSFVVSPDDTDAAVSVEAVIDDTENGSIFRFDVQAEDLNLDPEEEWFYDITYIRDGYSLSIKSGQLILGANVTNSGVGSTFIGGDEVHSVIATISDRTLLTVVNSMPVATKGDPGVGTYFTDAVLGDSLDDEVVIAAGDIETWGRPLQLGDLLFSSVTNEVLATIVHREFSAASIVSVTARTSMFIQGPKGDTGAQGPEGPPGRTTVAISPEPDNVLALDGDDLIKLTKSIINAAFPIGSVQMWAGQASTVPSGWLLCDGAVFNPVTYAALYSVIGTNYGGNGAAPKLPDLRGRVAAGLSGTDTTFNALGKTGGEKTHLLTENEMPTHTHVQDAHTHVQNPHGHSQSGHTHGPGSLKGVYGMRTSDDSGSGKRGALGYVYSDFNTDASDPSVFLTEGETDESFAWIFPQTATNKVATAVNQPSGGGQPHNVIQPYTVLNYIIKAA